MTKERVSPIISRLSDDMRIFDFEFEKQAVIDAVDRLGLNDCLD